ncbi:MAG: winged helix-turn-helix transcriptional regulator [Candidatus Omnitrophica bacterium]|nr:winged helix-turn-helix transcriptional regulator [Candidatus Omnitrophota bacterium]
MIDYEAQSEKLKALAHPVRLRIAQGLLGNECNVSKMIDVLNLPQSTVSQHLAVLKTRGIIAVRKEGVRSCYRVVDPQVKKIIQILTK